MISSIPTIDAGEIRRVVKELSTKENPIPMPERVEVTDAEDQDGEPVWKMKLVFPASMPPHTIPWKRISPLVHRFRRMIAEKAADDRFVLSEVRRLAEDIPELP